VSRPEAFLRWLNDDKVLARVGAGFNGLRAKLGGMVTGGGFGIGPEYFREDLLSGRMNFRAAAQTSTRAYNRFEVETIAPQLAGGRMFLSARAVHHNYSGLPYYGPGPDSAKTGRTNYRFEDVTADGLAGIQPARLLRLGASAGYTTINVGPGRDHRYASTDQTYTAAQVPGLDRQTDFTRYGPFFELDYRDDKLGPRNGGKYLFQQTWYDDRGLDRYSFRRTDVDLQQYIGLFNNRRVVALRARGVLTDAGAGHAVPFYLQPDLGGSENLRGFRPFRFRDNNLLVLNGEYRWEVFSGLDMALFADAGKVFARRSQLNFHDLESTAGFGFRFNARNRTFLRLDVGFSHEGFQIWFKFNDLFAPRPLGAGGTHPVL
jgi:outer membrane protein assembly factor BamA